jgi:hypothetical protein
VLKDKLVLLETLALKEPLDPQGCKELRDQLELQVKLALLVRKVLQGQLVQLEFKEQLGLLVKPEPLALLEHRELLVQQEQPVRLVKLVQHQL